MIRGLLVLAALAACNDKQPTPAPKQPAAPVPVVVADAPEPRQQLITGVIDDWSSTQVELRLWTRLGSAPWQPVGEPWPAVIGRNGASAAYGDTPKKREGDGTAPAGRFTLRGAYGYAPAPPTGTLLSYTPATSLECIDDPASAHYTRIVDGTKTPRDWTSSERMRLASNHYKWVIDIAHNASATPGRGSCIFFHVWAGPDDKTDGCTAMAEDTLVALLEQLDPAADPQYVLLPRAEYAALQAAWSLPPL